MQLIPVSGAMDRRDTDHSEIHDGNLRCADIADDLARLAHPNSKRESASRLWLAREANRPHPDANLFSPAGHKTSLVNSLWRNEFNGGRFASL